VLDDLSWTFLYWGWSKRKKLEKQNTYQQPHKRILQLHTAQHAVLFYYARVMLQLYGQLVCDIRLLHESKTKTSSFTSPVAQADEHKERKSVHHNQINTMQNRKRQQTVTANTVVVCIFDYVTPSPRSFSLAPPFVSIARLMEIER
jgi:hypothetical protein